MNEGIGPATTGAERARIATFGHPEDSLSTATPWYLFGPYVSERAWGTVREDYSADGTAWEYLPHDHARSRAYRWSEDGLAGLCDVHQRLCLTLALWNGQDPILKERAFGLTGNEGNHGEDVKEYFWFLDAVPSHAWLRWRYHYPQAAFPYADLVAEARRRGRLDPEYELLDTGVFDGDRFWAVEVAYAKAGPDDILMRIRARNAGPDPARLSVLPTLTFRNTWSWGDSGVRPQLAFEDGAVTASHTELGDHVLRAGPGPDGAQATPLFCENETNAQRLFGVPSGTPYPKDGINDHVVEGAATVNPALVGTRAALRYDLEAGPGESVELRLRLSSTGVDVGPEPLGAAFTEVMTAREAEADEFYAEVVPAAADEEQRRIARQAFAGMIWGKQYYNYDVRRWLDGDPGQPTPPASRLHGRNWRWRNVEAADVLSMPDAWEYPWFAAWDLAFHTTVLAHLDPAFAKYQLIVLCREWFQHPDGALPAYEWAFDDVNPPVHAWAALHVWAIDGRRDRAFLVRIFHKLLLNFTWWVNQQDPDGQNLFTGGFLGLDNIGPFDRSHLPVPGSLEQSDATAWMAFYCVTMLRIAVVLAEDEPAYNDIATKFLEHYVSIVDAMNTRGLWDEETGFYFDMLVQPDGTASPVRVHSLVGMLALLPTVAISREQVGRAAAVSKGFARLLERSRGQAGRPVSGIVTQSDGGLVLGPCDPDRLRRLLREALDENGFLSPHGLRSLSRRHLAEPYTFRAAGVEATVDYEPAESTTTLFGGNSNWRGPVWFPLNYLLIEALERYAQYLPADFTVELPTGSGKLVGLGEVATELRRRLVSLYLPGPDGRRPAFGGVEPLQSDPAWNDALLFFEYFHGDNGAGLGAMHQTGWTGLIANIVLHLADPAGQATEFATEYPSPP